MRRKLLGLIALACFAFAAVILLFPPLAIYQPAGAMGLRAALVLGVFWLAWPDLHRLPRWFWYLLPLLAIAILFARGVLIFLLPALALSLLGFLAYRKVWR